jgi:hypothetical protein
MVEVEIKFNAVGGAQEAELYLASAIAAMRKGLARQQRGLMAEAMSLMAKTIDARLDYELAGRKFVGLSFGKTLRTDRCGSHKPQLYRETMTPRSATNNVLLGNDAQLSSK